MSAYRNTLFAHGKFMEVRGCSQASESAHDPFSRLHLYIMNTLIVGVSNSWTALVFGAVFNLLATSVDETLIVFAIKTVIGGAIWMVFQVWADHIKRKNSGSKNEHKNSEEKKEQ